MNSPSMPLSTASNYSSRKPKSSRKELNGLTVITRAQSSQPSAAEPGQQQDENHDDAGREFSFALSPVIRRRRGNNGGSPTALSQSSTTPASTVSAAADEDETSSQYSGPPSTGLLHSPAESEDGGNSMSVILEQDPVYGGDDENGDPSFLHFICRTATSGADLQRAIGDVTVEAASLADQNGRTPLHVLSRNKSLSRATNANRNSLTSGHSSGLLSVSPGGLQRAFSHGSATTTTSAAAEQASNDEEALSCFVEILFRAYPAAMITTDTEDGHIPFESALHEFVECNLDTDQQRSTSSRSLQTSEKQLSTLIPTLWEFKGTVASRWANATGQGYQQHRNSKSSFTNSMQHGGGGGGGGDIESGGDPPTEKLVSRDRTFPKRVRVSSHMLSSLHMLSALLDALDTVSEQLTEKSTRGSIYSSRHRSRSRKSSRALDALNNMTVQDISDSIIQTIASVPDLVKTVLFIEDEEQKSHCLGTTLIQRVLTSKYSVGSWLTGMLQSHKKEPAELAVQYLHIISCSVSIEQQSNANSTKKRKKGRVEAANQEENDDLCQEISRLPDFVPSLLSLGDKQIEEAATTRVVQKVLDQIISRPFVVTVVFCDALFLAILISGYRGAVSGLILGISPSAILRYIYLANVGIFYFVLREIGKAISLCMITRRARIYFFSFWNLTDLLSTILSLVSVIAIRRTMGSPGLRNLCAVTTGFLWLRVLSFLKGINMQLATFVLAILQITRDILWFCVILFTFVVSFSQMFFTLLAPPSCKETNEETKECTQSEYYLKVYAILLGDFGLFERESFTSLFSVCLVVLYSFMVVLVLLNVLIAVASDSYEKCLIRSRNLFGRARTMMIAELVSFQNLLKRNEMSDQSAGSMVYATWWSSDSWAHGWSRGSVVFFGLSSLVVVTWTVAEVLGHLVGTQYGNLWMSLGSVCVNVALFVCIMLVLSVGASEKTDKKFCGEWYGRYFQKAMLRMLGSSGGKSGSVQSGMDLEWNGRLLYLRNEMVRLSKETKEDCRSMMRLLEDKMHQSETLLRSEAASIERGLSDLTSERQAMKDQIHESLAEILATVQDNQKSAGVRRF